MAEALEKVKKELGPQAVILHTRTLRKGGVMGVGARTIVEITASLDPRTLPGTIRSRCVRVRETVGCPYTGCLQTVKATLITQIRFKKIVVNPYGLENSA